jgi:hypothetical protein
MDVRSPVSAERECKRLGAGIEELDLEAAIGNRSLLPDQLVQTLLVYAAVTVGVHVEAVSGTWRLAVD